MAFYRRELGRDVALADDEEIIVERQAGAVIAAVRLAPEGGALTLRTMVVAEAERGHGIGSGLLERASSAIGKRECVCVPWAHLEAFYGRVGFVRVPKGALPPHLRERVGSEQTVIAMRRMSRK